MAAVQQTLTQGHPEAVWGALLGSIAIISSLVGLLYNRLNKDIQSNKDSLSEGQKAFETIGKALVTLGKDIERLSSAENASMKDIEQIQEEINSLRDTLLVMTTKHNHNHPADKIHLQKAGAA